MTEWPIYQEDEVQIVVETLRSGKVNYWTGEHGRSFEREYAEYVGVNHAVAVANGTVALELCLRAVDVGVGDEVIVTARSFVASASTVLGLGAVPVFADIDENSQNITALSIESVLTSKTKAVVCVHLSGFPCEMNPIMELAEAHGVFVIEDCAQAHGSKYCGRSVGSIGHLSAWSFCQDKIMSTGGEGGMITTDNPDLWKRVWSMKDHGKLYEKMNQKQTSSSGSFRYVHDMWGTNYRLTEMQSAIGRLQLRKLDGWVKERRVNAARLTDLFQHYDNFIIPSVPDHSFHSFYKFYVLIRLECLRDGWSRDRMLTEMREAGVKCFSGSCPTMYREGMFSSLQPVVLPNAESLAERTMMFLVHPGLSNEYFIDIERALSDIVRKAVK